MGVYSVLRHLLTHDFLSTSAFLTRSSGTLDPHIAHEDHGNPWPILLELSSTSVLKHVTPGWAWNSSEMFGALQNVSQYIFPFLLEDKPLKGKKDNHIHFPALLSLPVSTVLPYSPRLLYHALLFLWWKLCFPFLGVIIPGRDTKESELPWGENSSGLFENIISCSLSRWISCTHVHACVFVCVCVITNFLKTFEIPQ